MSLRRVRALAIGFVLAWPAACGDNDGGEGGKGEAWPGQLDPRCESLCADGDAACTGRVEECKSVCQVRAAGMSALCATCLLENSNSGSCQGGASCCPAPSFPNSVLDCADACAASGGVNPPGDHPVCAALCADDDPACSADVAPCLQECKARVQGVSGLCALCLLEGANNGSCAPGMPCCPNPTFPTTVAACAGVCGG